MEEVVIKNKKKYLDRSKFAKRMIDFINSKSTTELKEHDMPDIITCAIDFNKMIVRNIQRITAEEKIKEIKEAISIFNILFDKRVRARLPSCWDLWGNLLPLKTYETLLVEEKRKVDNAHERTTVLKGATIVNFLNKDFKLLWMVKTLFSDKPTYGRITACRIALKKVEEAPKSNVPLWKKCKEWMIKQNKNALAGPHTQAIDPNNEQQSPIILRFLSLLIFLFS